MQRKRARPESIRICNFVALLYHRVVVLGVTSAQAAQGSNQVGLEQLFSPFPIRKFILSH